MIIYHHVICVIPEHFLCCVSMAVAIQLTLASQWHLLTGDEDKRRPVFCDYVNLTPLPPFHPQTEPSSISQHWKSWKTSVWDVLGHSEYNRGQAEESPITLPGWTSHARNLWHTQRPERTLQQRLQSWMDTSPWRRIRVWSFSISTGCSESRWNSWPVYYLIQGEVSKHCSCIELSKYYFNHPCPR